MTLPRFLQFMQQRGGKSAGAIRVSLGLVSNFADVERFLAVRRRLPRPDAAALGALTFDDRQLPRHPRRQLTQIRRNRGDRKIAEQTFLCGSAISAVSCRVYFRLPVWYRSAAILAW